MSNLLNPGGPSSKYFFSTGTLPRFIDPNQPPTKKKPCSTIMNQPFNHTIDLILPDEVYELIWESLEAKIPPLHYSRVIMPLSALLEGEFFNYYIKAGNIAMLSEGRPGIDDTYSLKDGTLRLLLSKETYERTGLQGKPIRDTGRKHLKTRYGNNSPAHPIFSPFSPLPSPATKPKPTLTPPPEISLNLRAPSMLHGKKGFERLVWAAKHILTRSLTWLFHDFHPASPPLAPPPLNPHHPSTHTPLPLPTPVPNILIPNLHAPTSLAPDHDTALALHEYLALITLHSPRLAASDAIDPLLSRYEVPDAESARVGGVVHVRWRGFIPAVWVRGVVVELCKMQKTVDEKKGWWAMSAHAFEGEPVGGRVGWTVLRLASGEDGAGGQYLLWEVER